MSILVAIPSRANIDGLLSVIDQSLNSVGVSKVVVYDNGYEDGHSRELIKEKCAYQNAVGWPFYKMWNHAWKTAAEEGFYCVALLNDDITIDKDSLAEASTAFQMHPNTGIVGLNYRRNVSMGTRQLSPAKVVHGSFRNGGIGGHAFLIRSSTYGVVPPIDESYALWYGDDELFENMERAGFELRIATGAPVDHSTSTTSVKFPELLACTAQDAALYHAKWG